MSANSRGAGHRVEIMRCPLDMRSKDVLEIGEWLDVVAFGGGPAFGAAIGAGEQVVLAAGALNGVGIELEAAVVEEATACIPAGQGVAYGIADGRGAGGAAAPQPWLHVGDKRQGPGLA